ncbi:MAG: metal-dependent hydrolase [Haloglomus sp.]
MPPTVVHAALGVILAAAALGPAFDRRAATVALLAGAAPDLDAALGLLAVPLGFPITESTHGAVLHTLLVPGLAGVVLYLDARWDRRLVDRLAPGDVRLAWIAITVYAVAGIGLDLLNVATANPLWPVHDMFYAVVGQLMFTNQELFVQTYVAFGKHGYAVYVGQRGGTAAFFVPSPLNPVLGPNGNTERVVDVVESGWQLLVLGSAPVIGWLAARSGTAAVTEANTPSSGGGGNESGVGEDAERPASESGATPGASGAAGEESPAPTDD